MNLSPGIHDNIPMSAYIADTLCDEPSLSASCAFRLATKSPLHAWQSHPRLGKGDRAEANVADTGSVAHELLLGGEERIAVIDPADYRSKPTKQNPEGNIPLGWTNDAIREARDAARAAGRIPMLLDDMPPCREMVRVAREFIASSEIAGAFDHGGPERTIIWREGDQWFRARPDWLSPTLCLHYKTTDRDAEPESFIRGIMRSMGYDFGLRFYARGLAALRQSVERHLILVQEQNAPYACCLIGLTPAKSAIQDARVAHAVQVWSTCMVSGSWPAYGTRVHYAEPTAYEMAEAEAAA